MAKGRYKTRKGIRQAGVITYSDTGQTVSFVEWDDGTRTTGAPDNLHMQELLRRAEREGKKLQHKVFGGGVW